MALVLADRVKESSTTTGTGTFTLDGAVTGYQTFSSAIGNGNTCYYTIASQTLNEWEVGIGTVGASSLARTTILSSSNAGSAVTFSAGTKDVFVTYPAEKSVYRDSANKVVQQSFDALSVTNTATIGNAALTTGTISTTPSVSSDITNKSYVDGLVASGVHFHTPVRLESPTPLTVTYNNGTAGVGATLTNAGTQVALSIDGVATAVNDRILVYTQADATQNGVYVVTDIGSGSTNWVMTRSDDTDTYGIDSPNALSQGSTFFVSAGNTGAGETYTCNTVGTITFGTTNITFAQISSAQIYSAGTGLTLTSTTFSITNTAVSTGSYGSASSVPNYTVNAQGQLTYAANTPIAISYTAVSGLAASATTDTTNASNITSGTLPTGRLSGSYTGVTGVGTLAAGTWNASTIGVGYGGTGLTTYTAGDLIYASGTSTLATIAAGTNGYVLTMSAGVPTWTANSNVSSFSAGTTGLTPSTGTSGAVTLAGTLNVANGGTGATTLTGYVKGSGTSAFTASSTIPNTDVSGLGTMSTQNASSVAITGGSINGTSLGASTAASAKVTTLDIASGLTLATAAGSSGQVLTSAGSGSVPTWTTPVSSNITATGLWENAATISTNYTIGTNNNAVSAGPITVASGVVVTVPSGSTWVVV